MPLLCSHQYLQSKVHLCTGVLSALWSPEEAIFRMQLAGLTHTGSGPVVCPLPRSSLSPSRAAVPPPSLPAFHTCTPNTTVILQLGPPHSPPPPSTPTSCPEEDQPVATSTQYHPHAEFLQLGPPHPLPTLTPSYLPSTPIPCPKEKPGKQTYGVLELKP